MSIESNVVKLQQERQELMDKRSHYIRGSKKHQTLTRRIRNTDRNISYHKALVARHAETERKARIQAIVNKEAV